MIPLNKPFLTGNEQLYISQALLKQTSGNGPFTKKCHEFFMTRFQFKKVLLTTSCTDALEMSAILIDIRPGDEVIMPSYTFVSTANAFLLRGAKIIFVDSLPDHPNMDPDAVERVITERTKAIVVVHYAGTAVNMDRIIQIANEHGIFVVEDAAQAIDSYFNQRPLGGIGHLGCISFHETKNIISGEGGMLIINEPTLRERAEILWEKGTNRSAFIRGEIDKYGWVDIGSSFLPSEVVAAFLYAQLESLDQIQGKRKTIWDYYYNRLSGLGNQIRFQVPRVPNFAVHNAHIFYIVLDHRSARDKVIDYLRKFEIQAFFHYGPLHLSPYFLTLGNGRRTLPNAERFAECLLRLPLHLSLAPDDQDLIIDKLRQISVSL
jgi:dTDP-4-amino-4,6-dideoxygalactose transaminase